MRKIKTTNSGQHVTGAAEAPAERVGHVAEYLPVASSARILFHRKLSFLPVGWTRSCEERGQDPGQENAVEGTGAADGDDGRSDNSSAFRDSDVGSLILSRQTCHFSQ